MYEELLHLVTQYSKSFFYFGVGSCPHVATPEELQPCYDQLLPCFLKEIALNKQEQIQVLHIDPDFKYQKEFLHQYFALHLPDAIYYEEESLQIWESPGIQIVCASIRFDHPSNYINSDDEWFVEALTEEAIRYGFRMVYQEYTGIQINNLFLKLYQSYDETMKERFRNLILFDISYGNDTGCSTNMIKYKPLYEANGMFLNLQLYSDEELLQRINTHPAINERVSRTIIGRYRQILNDIHVDYRRKSNGDPLFYPSKYSYTESSMPSEIMKCLEDELFHIVPLLQKLGALSPDATITLKDLFQNYQIIDRYKWYDNAFKLLKFESGSPLL